VVNGKDTVNVHSKLLTTILIVAALGACSGGGGGSSNQPSQQSGSQISTSDLSQQSGFAITGSIGDGPIVDAEVVVRDRNGEVVATGQSDQEANYTIDIPADAALPLTIHVTGGTDLVTGRSADFELVAMINETGLQTANVSPLTTVAVKAAQCRGTETVTGMNKSWDDLAGFFTVGFDRTELGDPMTQLINENNIETAVLANEALGELIRRTGSAFGGSIPLDQIVDVLACDLADGALDGQAIGDFEQDEKRIFAVARASELVIRLEVVTGALRVDGMDATSAMNSAIRTIMPKVHDADVNNVPVTQDSLEDTIVVIDELMSVLPDPELPGLRAVLAGASPVTATDALEAEMDSATLATLNGMADRIALMDMWTIGEFGFISDGDVFNEEGLLAEEEVIEVTPEPPVDEQIPVSEPPPEEEFIGVVPIEVVAPPVEEVPVAPVEPTVELLVDDALPLVGGSVRLNWTSQHAQACFASDGWSGDLTDNGEETVSQISVATTYTITCTNDTGSDSASVSVTPMGELNITWQAPTENEDGTDVLALSGYRIQYGVNSGQYTDVVDVAGEVTTHSLRLPLGEYYLAMTALDVLGHESDLSNEVLLSVQ